MVRRLCGIPEPFLCTAGFSLVPYRIWVGATAALVLAASFCIVTGWDHSEKGEGMSISKSLENSWPVLAFQPGILSKPTLGGSCTTLPSFFVIVSLARTEASLFDLRLNAPTEQRWI